VGLDAVVYRNRQHLQLGHDAREAKTMQETGEVYFEDDEITRRYREQLKANKMRLGNVTEIAELRDEISRLAVPARILRDKILYSGSHSGDSIPVGKLAAVIDEIRSIRSTGNASKELNAFLDSIEELVRTALNETNPIVFV
jgi:hypothetical protein